MRRVGGLVAVLVLLSACGERSEVGAAAGTEDQVTDTTTSVEAETTGVNPSETIVGDPMGTLLEPSGPPADLGGVTVDDPLPAQADALTDPAGAEEAVRYAFRHWILIDLDRDLRARLIENGEGAADALADGFEAARGIVYLARIQVDSVSFPSADRAQVAFRIEWNDGPSPYFPDRLLGTAVFQDGTWRVARRTLCFLALGSGQDCAGQGPHPPSPPSYTAALPAGYEWSGFSEPAEFVGTDVSAATWLGTGSVAISATSLVGVSAIDPADVDAFLASGRLGVTDGTPITVGPFPGRVLVTEGQVSLVVVRDDDVVVSVQWSGADATVDAVLAIASSLVPNDTAVVYVNDDNIEGLPLGPYAD